MCYVLKQHGTTVLKKHKDKFDTKQNFGQKLGISTNSLQIVDSYCAKAVLNWLSDAFYRLVIYAVTLDVLMFF